MFINLKTTSISRGKETENSKKKYYCSINDIKMLTFIKNFLFKN